MAAFAEAWLVLEANPAAPGKPVQLPQKFAPLHHLSIAQICARNRVSLVVAWRGAACPFQCDNREVTNATPKILGHYSFEFVGFLEPDCDANGGVLRLLPQPNYAKASTFGLHRYGDGPFCRFRWNATSRAGVYAFLVGHDARYVGECINLASRFNSGYGQISPKNCYKGGQQTNCRVNNLVLGACERGEHIGVWFHACEQRKEIEKELIGELQPRWNRRSG